MTKYLSLPLLSLILFTSSCANQNKHEIEVYHIIIWKYWNYFVYLYIVKRSVLILDFSSSTIHFWVTLRLLTGYTTVTRLTHYVFSAVTLLQSANMSLRFYLTILTFILNNLLFVVKYAVDCSKHALGWNNQAVDWNKYNGIFFIGTLTWILSTFDLLP